VGSTVSRVVVTVDALEGADAVVHLAAIPASGLKPDELTFRVNTCSTYNVFAAAPLLGRRRPRGDGEAAQPLERDPARRPSPLERDGAARLAGARAWSNRCAGGLELVRGGTYG
jgi:hypothetical protein